MSGPCLTCGRECNNLPCQYCAEGHHPAQVQRAFLDAEAISLQAGSQIDPVVRITPEGVVTFSQSLTPAEGSEEAWRILGEIATTMRIETDIAKVPEIAALIAACGPAILAMTEALEGPIWTGDRDKMHEAMMGLSDALRKVQGQ